MIKFSSFTGDELQTKLIKPCPYLLPCGICDKAGDTSCVQYGVYKIEQEYVDKNDFSCETCLYRDKGKHEEPCKNCCQNYTNHWRFDETAN